ncbi:type III secretion system cytoplasmic ring protein SctQ [Aeromonas salmonicida]|uniref:type III secretion system cytoplasmic ring protein SctQ n=1 Tax=Aeromonas salmonicida TaxID=645 RepID=UPI00259D82A8|nr:type III secretion system cytoplasmic ring protein SctQ [Aeromonas salmonicida]MDM5065515.1 type III secretion system cytoplasmic ring protein SctQ [Aeromonas salmonicida]
MRHPRLSETDGRLLSLVGMGRQWQGDAVSLRLTFGAHAQAPGLLLQAALDEGPLRLWFDEAQWCRWVAPMLAIPSLAMVPDALRPLLVAWTLADADPSDDALCWPQARHLEEADADAGWGWQLRLLRDDRQLDCRILSAPECWLESLVAITLPATPPPPPDIQLDASLLAGWSMLDRATYAALQAGDALLLDKQWDVGAGKFALFTQSPLASLRQNRDSGELTVEALMDNFDDWMDIAPLPEPEADRPTPLANHPIAVTVEVARLTIPLQELYQLDVGSLLSGEASYDGAVTLRVGGHPFARGTLMHIGDRLAVRIEKRF